MLTQWAVSNFGCITTPVCLDWQPLGLHAEHRTTDDHGVSILPLALLMDQKQQVSRDIFESFVLFSKLTKNQLHPENQKTLNDTFFEWYFQSAFGEFRYRLKFDKGGIVEENLALKSNDQDRIKVFFERHADYVQVIDSLSQKLCNCPLNHQNVVLTELFKHKHPQLEPLRDFLSNIVWFKNADKLMTHNDHESLTQSLYLLAIDTKTTLKADALDRLIERFSHPETNPQNAQLIISTDSPVVLNSDKLRPDEIWAILYPRYQPPFCYSLAELKEKDLASVRENLSQAYEEGLFGPTNALKHHDAG